MENIVKKIVITLFIIAALVGAGYFGYQLYLSAIDDATTKIRKGVSEGVSEGIGKGAGDVINPLKWFTPKK